MAANKTLNQEDVKQYVTEDLIGKIKEDRLALKKLEFNHAVTPLDNPSIIRVKRRDVARMLTELNNRSIVASK